MSDETLALENADEEPGLKKSFWAHLEDLRHALIRACICIAIALVLCLVFVNRLVSVLEYPLRNIDLFSAPQPSVTFQVGKERLGPYNVSREQFSGLPTGTAPHPVYQIDTAMVAGQQVATLKLLPESGTSDAGPLKVRLHNFGPAEGFMVAFHVALYGALVVSAPFWMYFIGSFIFPALNMRERDALLPWVGWSVVLFAVGVSSTYFGLLPIALRASVEYSRILGFEGFDWRADDYISFVTRFILGMGLGFQFPIVVLFLVKLGIVTHKHLAHYRRHVAVLCTILGAVLTTPEVITQLAMAVPLYLLYETCIWIAWYWERKKKRLAAAGGSR